MLPEGRGKKLLRGISVDRKLFASKDSLDQSHQMGSGHKL